MLRRLLKASPVVGGRGEREVRGRHLRRVVPAVSLRERRGLAGQAGGAAKAPAGRLELCELAQASQREVVAAPLACQRKGILEMRAGEAFVPAPALGDPEVEQAERPPLVAAQAEVRAVVAAGHLARRCGCVVVAAANARIE